MNEERNLIKKISTRKNLFVWVLVLVAMAAIALGGGGEFEPIEPAAHEAEVSEAIEVSVEMVAEEPAASSDAEITAATVSETSASDAASSTGAESASVGSRIQSITFGKDTMIVDALHVLEARYQKNIVPSAKVQGNITFMNLHDVTFEQAMDAILGYNFKYEAEGNIIKVYTTDEYRTIQQDPERMVYEVFTVYYISAAEAMKLIKPVLSGSNSAKIEVSTPAETAMPIGESIQTVTGGGDSPASNDTLIVYDYPENIAKAAALLKKLDMRPRQVLIEATILTVNLTEDMQFGIDWSNFEDIVTGLPDITKNTDFFSSEGTSQVTGTGGLTMGVSLGGIAAFIRAVETVTDTTILANPKILAVNKQLGQVYIGQKLGYQSQVTQNDNTTTSQITFLDTGTKLSFRPYIGDDGYIRMDIHPKDSSGSLDVEQLPEETAAELVTNIIVKDGQTIVIGGMFRDKLISKRTQVPLLGDIPFVGTIFRGRADEVVRQEVVVLLTPHIVKEPSDVDGDARADDADRKKYGAIDELQDIGRGKRAEEYYAKAARYHVDGDNTSALEQLERALRLRPSFLEALRLKERILTEMDPAAAEELDRIIQLNLDRREAPMWLRR
ncbi:MAG: type II secretion system protein GspD [Planctomycetota bacterium]|jgi:type II secretory pathway component GspD/PulD (secretin)